MKEDNCNSTDLNSGPKGNKNIDQNRMVFTKIFRKIIVLQDDTIQIILLGPNAVNQQNNKSLEPMQSSDEHFIF